jgi:SagB-type dehydrogenase family enzyme
MMIRFEDPTSLSALFHLNSEPWLNDEAYQSAAAAQEFKQPEQVLAETALPAPSQGFLSELLRQRCSCRAYALETLPLSALGDLLAAAYGAVALDEVSNRMKLLRRSVPSAGGLFPLEVYAFLRRTEGLEDGLYHYNVVGHSLQLMRRGDLFPLMEPVFYTYPFILHANLVVCLAAVFRRTQKKYGPRGYRYILLEAGHCGQNFCLKAAELGLSTLCMGGFVDSDLNMMLGLQQKEEGVVYTVAAGYAAAK